MTPGAQPLRGRRILVTRPRAQAPELVERLSELGAEAIAAPAIRIVPPDDTKHLDDACAAASSFDWIVFTSANGVDAFMERLLARGAAQQPVVEPRVASRAARRPPGKARRGSILGIFDRGATQSRRDASPLECSGAFATGCQALEGVRICAIGPATGARIAGYGLQVDLAPAQHRGEGVSAALRTGRDLRGARILLPRADIARPLLPDALRAAGAAVVEVTAYRTIAAPAWPGAEVHEMLRQRRVDAVTFTSASAVRSAVQSLGRDPAARLLGATIVAAIGPVTARAGRQLGIATTVMPSTFTAPALTRAIADYFAGAPAAHSA